jgi:pimeloyl-ACP methyl ester carboxylesterase
MFSYPLRTLPGLLLVLTLAFSGCSHYSKAIQKGTSYRSSSAAGQLIALAQKQSAKQPLTQIGHYLDAAASAGTALKGNPSDNRARADYNFAVARVFEVINDAGLQPWKTPLQCPGASQTWNLSFQAEALKKLKLDPSIFQIRPADRFEFKGRLVVDHCVKEGIGAPVIVNTRDFDITTLDPFAQGKHAYYGATGVVEFNGSQCTAALIDPLTIETVNLSGQSYPLSANFTAPIALALAELKPRKKELGGLFKPDQFATGPRLARLQPYDPKKIPILCIHGLGDSQATWAPMIETLRADPVIRQNYQVWFFSYPSGYPYPYSASILRKQMDAIKARCPGHKEIVLLGHSMGGMISRTLMTDSGMALWDATYPKPPAQMNFTEETRQVMSNALIFKHRTDISRVIFLSPSHRGANMATSFFGRMGAKLIGGPKNMVDDITDVLSQANPSSTGQQLKKMPNSIDFLNPENRFVKNLDKLPLAPGIPFHTILGDRGKGGNLSHTEPVSSDGIVPYWSSHLDGAQSEVIIPSGHWTNQHPQGIAEVKRILHLHLKSKP